MQRQSTYHSVCKTFTTKLRKFAAVGHSCRFHLVFAACMAVLVSSLADSAYLPTIGPAPLRFRPALIPITSVVAPIVAVPAPPAVPLPTNEPVKTLAPTATLIPQDQAFLTDQIDFITDSASSDKVISRQMLLKYFTGLTNGNAAGFGAPIDFIPPSAMELPSSKAEYSVPPH
jgi:hypothetical protein